MVTDVVTFRMEREELEILRRRGLNPAELARTQLKRHVQGIRVEEGMREAQRLFKRMGGKPFDAAEAIREGREER